MDDDDWKAAWQPLVDAVGSDFSDGDVVPGADVLERGAIRRFVEPLEIDAAIHHDPIAAREHGHADVVAPATAVLALSLPAMWEPGEPTLYADADRDAGPARTPLASGVLPLAPPTTGFFAADLAVEFVRQVVAGERLGRRGRRLLACVPKETSVGRGAFVTWETEIVSDRGDVVARMRATNYAYTPRSEEISPSASG